MSNFKSDEQHKQNLKNMGRIGALVITYFVACYLAIYFNMDYRPHVPWFLVVIIIGGFFLVPRARAVLRAFEDNMKD
jgi:hypothetical protein